MPVRRRSVAGSLPRRGVGCCVPQLTHLRSQDIHRRQPLGRSGFLAPAPPSWPGLFFWWRPSYYGEQRPSVPPTQMKATHALLRMIKVSSVGPNSRAGGGCGRPAFRSPLRVICWPFAWHSGALKGNASCRLVGLLGMNEVADATVRSGDCHPGADAAARGAMGTINSYIAVASQTEFKPHTKPRSIRARPSAERRVGRALTAFNNESGQQPIADPMCDEGGQDREIF